MHRAHRPKPLSGAMNPNRSECCARMLRGNNGLGGRKTLSCHSKICGEEPIVQFFGLRVGHLERGSVNHLYVAFFLTGEWAYRGRVAPGLRR
jgi:hypothetical protein